MNNAVGVFEWFFGNLALCKLCGNRTADIAVFGACR